MLRIALVLTAVIVVAIGANIALLSLATTSDPVGRLSPVVAVRPAGHPTVVNPAPPRLETEQGPDD